jgi:hypothetical protein
VGKQRTDETSTDMEHRELPQALVKLSAEQLERAPRLTKAQITEAIEAGQRDRAAAEAAPSPAPIAPKILYR